MRSKHKTPFLPLLFPSNQTIMDAPLTLSPGVPGPTVSSPITLDIVRCSRCQQSLSVGTQSSGAVQFGMNSYYCNRCASKVGFVR